MKGGGSARNGLVQHPLTGEWVEPWPATWTWGYPAMQHGGDWIEVCPVPAPIPLGRLLDVLTWARRLEGYE